MPALLLLLVCATACALPSNTNIIQDVIGSPNKPTMPSTGRRLSSLGIVGGKEATIDMYPFAASLLATPDQKEYFFICGATILNTRSVLTSAKCEISKMMSYLVRVGSALTTGGGTVYNTTAFITHPDGDISDADVAIVRIATDIVYVPHAVQPAVIATADYNLADNEKVWSIGWGAKTDGSYNEDQLRHVQIYAINQSVCERLYTRLDPAYDVFNVTDKMLCAGVPEGKKGECSGDEGAPLIHNGVVVGISLWGIGCGRRLYPGVYTRVSSFAEWIEKNK